MKKWQLIFSAVLLSASGCVTNATTELTEAPFVATTDITNGTTAAAADITGAVTDFTSSSTPGAASSDGPALARKRLHLFASSSYENLRADISRGGGEYLVSLATLAGVSSDRLAEFQFFMQSSYATMFDDTVPVKDSTTRIVDTAWGKGYGRHL
jgi:Protein of unknown function (DUF3015)